MIDKQTISFLVAHCFKHIKTEGRGESCEKP